MAAAKIGGAAYDRRNDGVIAAAENIEKSAPGVRANAWRWLRVWRLAWQRGWRWQISAASPGVIASAQNIGNGVITALAAAAAMQQWRIGIAAKMAGMKTRWRGSAKYLA